MVTVFHNKKCRECLFLFDEKKMIDQLGNQKLADFEEVAKVNTDNLNMAYELTQHINQSWDKNCDVKVIKTSRSSSMGDVFYLNGKFYGVAATGFVEIVLKD